MKYWECTDCTGVDKRHPCIAWYEDDNKPEDCPYGNGKSGWELVEKEVAVTDIIDYIEWSQQKLICTDVWHIRKLLLAILAKEQLKAAPVQQTTTASSK